MDPLLRPSDRHTLVSAGLRWCQQMVVVSDLRCVEGAIDATQVGRQIAVHELTQSMGPRNDNLGRQATDFSVDGPRVQKFETPRELQFALFDAQGLKALAARSRGSQKHILVDSAYLKRSCQTFELLFTGTHGGAGGKV